MSHLQHSHDGTDNTSGRSNSASTLRSATSSSSVVSGRRTSLEAAVSVSVGGHAVRVVVGNVDESAGGFGVVVGGTGGG